MVIIASPKQDVADWGVTVVGPNKVVIGTKLPVTKNNETVMIEDEIVATWWQLVMRKNRNQAEMNGVVAGKKDFVTTVRNGVVQTTRVVARNGGATSTITHVCKNSHERSMVVKRNVSDTSSFKHVGKINPATSAGVVV